jgi:hypothetical protein
LFGLFLAPAGHPLPQHSQLKSAGALSRFLNPYGWLTRKVICSVQSWVLEQLSAWAPQGRRPHLQLIVDLTTLEKTGKFQQLPGLVRWYNRKRGLHLVVLYLVVGRWRIPWSFRIYRGKGSATPVQLALALCGLLMQQSAEEVDWAVAAQNIVRLLIPHTIIYSLLKELEPWRQEGLELGIELPNTR